MAFLAVLLASFAAFGALPAESFFILAARGADLAEDCFLAAFSAAFGVDGDVFLAFAAGAAELAGFLVFAAAFSNLALGGLVADFVGLAGLAVLALTDFGFPALLAFGGLLTAFAADLGAVECFVARTLGLPPFLTGLAPDRDAVFFADFVARAAIS